MVSSLLLQDHFESIQSTNWRSMRWKLPSLRIGFEYARRKQLAEAAQARDRET